LSEIFKIRNIWKLPSPFLRKTFKLWKDFLEFKNIILEEKLSEKFKIGQQNFSGVKVSIAWVFLLGYPKTLKVRDLQGSLSWEKFFITVFEFIGQLCFQNDVFKLQEVFSELEIRLFLENGLESFQTFLILQILDKLEVLKRF
jgi:hypothetical protein